MVSSLSPYQDEFPLLLTPFISVAYLSQWMSQYCYIIIN